MSPFDPQPTRYRGVVYPSQRALARHLGVHDATVYSALRRGTVDNIGAGRGPAKRPCELDGVTYPSIRAAARALGVNPGAIHRRLARQSPDAGNEHGANNEV